MFIKKEFLDFLKDLEQNNRRIWFEENKSRYEKVVKLPFEALIEDVLKFTKTLDSEITMEAKDAIFRINRDVRFAKEKIPYNTMMKAGMAKGKRNSPYPGFYLAIDKKSLYVGGGAFNVDAENLEKMRKNINNHTEKFVNLINNQEFTSLYKDGVQGEQMKRIPEEYKETFEKTPLIANKHFFYMAQIENPEKYSQDEILEKIKLHFKAIAPINLFLKEGLAT